MSLCSQWITENFKGQIADLQKPETSAHSDVLDQKIDAWLGNPERSEQKRLAKIVRNGISCHDRLKLWLAVSGGQNRLYSCPEFYKDMQQEYDLDMSHSDSYHQLFCGNIRYPFYELNEEGKTAAGQILYLLSYIHSDISFSPLVPPLVYLFLHFMDESQCFASVHSIVESDRALLDQSQSAVTVAAKTFQDILRSFKKPAHKCLQDWLSNDSPEVIILLPLWTSWIFKYLDLWTLIILLDHFIVEGPKVLYRAGLVMISLLYSHAGTTRKVTLSEVEGLMQECMQKNKVTGRDFMKAALGIKRFTRKLLKKYNLQNKDLLNAGKLQVTEVELQDVLAIHTVKDSTILSGHQWWQLNNWLPSSLRIGQAVCIFSTERDGCSIKTLYKKCENEEKTILVVKTVDKEVFGAFLSAPWTERFGKKNLQFFGTGESFVFSLSPEAEVFKWDGCDGSQNACDMFMAGDDHCLVIGGGSGQAIWLDEELNHGRSQMCSTFKNKPLTQLPGGDFQCLVVEIIAFS